MPTPLDKLAKRSESADKAAQAALEAAEKKRQAAIKQRAAARQVENDTRGVISKVLLRAKLTPLEAAVLAGLFARELTGPENEYARQLVARYLNAPPDAKRPLVVGDALLRYFEQAPKSRESWAPIFNRLVTEPADRETIADFLGSQKED